MLFITNTVLNKTEIATMEQNMFTVQGELKEFNKEVVERLVKSSSLSGKNFDKELITLFDKCEPSPEFYSELRGKISYVCPISEEGTEILFRKTSEGNTLIIIMGSECASTDELASQDIWDERYATLIYSGSRGRLCYDMSELPEDFKTEGNPSYIESNMPEILSKVLKPWDRLQDLPNYRTKEGYSEAVEFLMKDILSKIKAETHKVYCGVDSFSIDTIEGAVDAQTKTASLIAFDQQELGKLYGIQESIKVLKSQYDDFAM